MLVTGKDGVVREMTVSAASMGHIATTIAITDEDAKTLRRILDQSEKGFVAYMEQFLARFPSNRR